MVSVSHPHISLQWCQYRLLSHIYVRPRKLPFRDSVVACVHACAYIFSLSETNMRFCRFSSCIMFSPRAYVIVGKHFLVKISKKKSAALLGMPTISSFTKYSGLLLCFYEILNTLLSCIYPVSSFIYLFFFFLSAN